MTGGMCSGPFSDGMPVGVPVLQRLITMVVITRWTIIPPWGATEAVQETVQLKEVV